MCLIFFFQGVEMKYQISVMRAVVIILLTLASGYSNFSYAESPKGEPTLKQVIEKPNE
jgi:hypothetical protein